MPRGRLVFRHTISISDGRWGWGRWWAIVSPTPTTPTLVQAASFLSQSLLGSNSSVQVGGACLLLSPFHSTVMSLEAQATAGGKPGTGGARGCSQNVTTPRRKEAREADTRQLYLAVFLGLKVSASKADR